MRRLKEQLCEALRCQLGGGRQRPPEAGALLWRAFLDLSGQRGFGMAGPLPLRMTDIEAYARITGLPLGARHLDVILAMDAVFLQGAVPGERKASSYPLSAEVFDAVFGG